MPLLPALGAGKSPRPTSSLPESSGISPLPNSMGDLLSSNGISSKSLELSTSFLALAPDPFGPFALSSARSLSDNSKGDEVGSCGAALVNGLGLGAALP